MSQRNWETMLDVYIYDHLVRKKLHNTANSFMAEGKVSPDPVAIDTPGGLLFAWWSMFWDIYNAKTKDKHAVEYGLNVYIYDYLVKKKLLYTAKTFMSEVKVSPDHVVIDTPGGYLFAWWSVFWAFFIARTNEKHFESAAEAQLGKEKEQMKQPNSRNTETFQPLMDAGTIHHGQMVHGKYQGGVLSELQQLQSPTQQTVENKSEVNLWASPRQLPVDPSTVHGQGILQSKPGIGSAGLNPGVGAHPLKGWPFTVQKAFLQNQGQFQLSPQQQQQQQIMAQVQGQGNMTSSPMYGDMDPRRFTGLPRENLNSTDGQQNANSSKLINMPPVQQSYSQQDPLLSQQNNSTWTTNTVGPSNSQPSTPSTHTPNEGIAITGNMQHVNNMPMMYDYDAIGGLASSANQLLQDDMEPFGNVGALEDDLEPVFFLDDEFVESVIDILNWNPSEFIEPQPNPMNTETSQPHVDPRMALLKSGTTYHGEMVQGNHQEGGVSASLQQLIPLEAGEGESRKGRCTCKMSKCLQLNCECFAAGFYCSTEPPCSCIDCFNKPIHEATVASKTPASARGCNCKKSNCQKKYCGCFQGGVGCSIQCRCEGCKNTFGRKPLASV